MTIVLRLAAILAAALPALGALPPPVTAPARHEAAVVAPQPAARSSTAPTTIRAAIHAAIDDHRRVPYSHNSMPDTWDALTSADADPAHSGNVLTIYGNQSLAGGSSGTTTTWDREHLWPQSYGLGDDAACNVPFTDLHQLRPSEPDLNSSRGNKPFDWCPFRDCAGKPVRDGSGEVNRTHGDRWEVWPGRRGDVARALLYLDVRYEGGEHGVTGCTEPDLRLTDDRGLITTRPYPTDVAYMGMLSALVEWHLEDPPDDGERRRNDVVEQAQGNRNPFVDRPELVCAVWPVAACRRVGQAVWLPGVGGR